MQRTKKDLEKLSVIFLGGVGEIGKNLIAFRFGNDIIVVDCGLKFPEEDMLGIDFVIPDVKYLIDNKEFIRGIFITHGHEDHIGALPFILPQLDAPLYASPLTIGLIQNKMADARVSYRPDYREMRQGDSADVGAFSVGFIPVCHSIPDSMALAIRTPFGTILHTGDFKFDPTPIDGVSTDYSSFAEYGRKGVLLMLSDSTNIDLPGFTPSERIVGRTFERLFRLYKDKRIVIATFASNLHRVQQVFDAAAMSNRSIVLAGRSMINNVELAKGLGYLNVPDDIIITPQEAERLDGHRVTVLTTGSQGEPFSGLVLMSRGLHKQVRLGDNDLVIISATPIPGNEKLVNHTLNRLFARGCEVIYGGDAKTHVSGHASRDELTMMLSIVKPKYFVPVHGEYRHLVRHAQLAGELGVAAKNIFVLQNGDVLSFSSAGEAELTGKVQSGAVLVNGKALGEFDCALLRERRELSESGLVAVSLVLDADGQLAAPVSIRTKGSVYSTEDEEVYRDMEHAVMAALDQVAGDAGDRAEVLITEIRKKIRDLFGHSYRNYPTIIPLITKLKKQHPN